MPLARKRLINLGDTPYYHCVSRCVRRAYLCGHDKVTGKNYEHRRQWVEDRLLYLSTTFAIDVCAYAVMNNHTHLVLHVNSKLSSMWTDEEVIGRWHKLHKGTLLSRRFMAKEGLTEAEQDSLRSTINVYRNRLADISWFMRELNEPIARKANLEDECTGHFWEGRFKSQALLDEQALAACMVYVDLNPIRAGMHATPESSKYTSIRRRSLAFKHGSQPDSLMPLASKGSDQKFNGLMFNLNDYISLVNLTGQYLHPERNSSNVTWISPFLNSLNLESGRWLSLTRNFEKIFRVAAGSEETLCQYKKLNRQRSKTG